MTTLQIEYKFFNILLTAITSERIIYLNITKARNKR
jgi:hypothetical protein